MTKLRITPDGTVRGLWTDEIEWQPVGQVSVSRASHVEFCSRRQMWFVREGLSRNALRRWLQRFSGRAIGQVLYWARTRSEALAWEREHFGPGGAGWLPFNGQREPTKPSD